ncbi:MAG: hypothetical protein WCI51_02285 [Lentisphaerota bacterium]
MIISASCNIKWDPSDLYKKEKKAEQRWLFKAGGYLRQTVRRLIRRVKDEDGKLRRQSQPGSPPFSHESNRQFFKNLRDSILFAVDANAGTVIIGPMMQQEQVGKLHEFGGIRTAKTAPAAANRVFNVGDIGPVAVNKYGSAAHSLRIGGILVDPVSGQPVIFIKLKTVDQARHATRLNHRIQMARFAKVKESHYPRRPFMAPGLEKAAPRLDSMWYNTIQ